MTCRCLDCQHFSLRDPRVTEGRDSKFVKTCREMHSLGTGNCAEFPVSYFVSPTWPRDCEFFKNVPLADMPARIAWVKRMETDGNGWS